MTSLLMPPFSPSRTDNVSPMVDDPGTDFVTMDKIVSLCRRRGFVFPSSEIYGGLGSTFDYGHYGVLAKNNIRYQAEYAKKAYGKSWVERLHEIGMLSERFSGAHCVWVDDNDIDVMKQSGMQVIHNPSSNLRLLSGVAPVRKFLTAGVPVAFGLDSLGMNDDDDMLQDLRLSQLIHNNQPGVDSKPISSSAMLTMATEAGKAVADIEGIGVLVEGNYADVVLLSLPDVEGVPTGHSLADLLLKRGKSLHVRSVMVGGKMFIEDGRWQERSAAQLLDTLRAGAQTPPPQPAEIVTQLKDAVRRHLREY